MTSLANPGSVPFLVLFPLCTGCSESRCVLVCGSTHLTHYSLCCSENSSFLSYQPSNGAGALPISTILIKHAFRSIHSSASTCCFSCVRITPPVSTLVSLSMLELVPIVVHRELSARDDINGIPIADKIPENPTSSSNVFDEILDKIESIFKRDVK